jgi:hypothetical protein
MISGWPECRTPGDDVWDSRAATEAQGTLLKRPFLYGAEQRALSQAAEAQQSGKSSPHARIRVTSRFKSGRGFATRVESVASFAQLSECEAGGPHIHDDQAVIDFLRKRIEVRGVDFVRSSQTAPMLETREQAV